MCQIVQRTPRTVRRSVLEGISKVDADFARHLRENLMEFEDIFTYDDRSFLRIFRDVGMPSFARFLKATGPEAADQVYGRLSPELTDLLKEQITFMPPVPPEAADEVFARIVDSIERLKSAGLLTIKAAAAAPATAPATAATPALAAQGQPKGTAAG